MIDKLKRAMVERWKKEKKFDKNYAKLEEITNRYLSTRKDRADASRLF